MSGEMHETFLRLLGWEGKELAEFLPDWLNAARFLGLTDRDIEEAATVWMPKNWNLSSQGVKKCIAAYIREVAEIAKLEAYKADGKTLLYGNEPASPICIYANKLAGNGRLHISHPDYLIATVLNAFFHKHGSISGSAPIMNPACQHCVLNCMRADVSCHNRIPPSDVTWSWGIYCDEGPKTGEMIRCLCGENWNNVFITIPHDSKLGEVEVENESRVHYLAEQIKYGQHQISSYTGIDVTEAHVQAAADEYLDYLQRIEYLTSLVANADPQPITGNELTLFGVCVEIAFDTGYAYINEAVDQMILEVKESIAAGKGVLPKGAPKLACNFTPINVPWIDRAFRDNGVNLSFSTLFAPASMVLRYFDRKDIYRSVAKQCLASPCAVNIVNEANIVSEMIMQYPIDGMLYGFFAFDRWIGALQKTMIRIVEEKTGIPHFYLEDDFWNEERYSPEERNARIRGMCNCLKIFGMS